MTKNKIIAIHRWMDYRYGRPKICSSKDCQNKSVHFDWALKKGKTYARDKNNFLRLCRSCHRKYDLTPEKIKKYVKNLCWNTGLHPLRKNRACLYCKTPFFPPRPTSKFCSNKCSSWSRCNKPLSELTKVVK